MTANAVAQRPMDRLKIALGTDSVRDQFDNALKENSGSFVASIIDLVASDATLQQCEPRLIIMEALKAATLKLPINKSLGFAWVIPYKHRGVAIPQFQLGYKGYIQLAMRTGQYRYLNTGMVYEGIEVHRDLLTGQVTFTGQAASEKAQGYFAHLQLLNGFTKTTYMTKEEVVAHAKRYSRSYGSDASAWATNFDQMAEKTVLRDLLSHFGIMSIEMAVALAVDTDEAELGHEIDESANKDVLAIAQPGAEASAGEAPGKVEEAPF